MSCDSVDEAMSQIEEYEESIKSRLIELVASLTEHGIETARSWISKAQGDCTDAYVDYTFNASGDIIKAEIYLSGRDALFVEFGAGIHYNAGGSPHASQFGYGVGTYPGQTHAFDDHWYYTDKETGATRQLSYGTEGTYPMYHSATEIRNRAIQDAVEIFGR